MIKHLFVFFISLNVFVQADFTPNQIAPLLQLQSIENPTPIEALILTELATLEPKTLKHALNQLSGEQYTSLAVASEIAGLNFLRSLYNPVRLQVITSPCPYTCCKGPIIDFWVQGGGGQSFINNCKHAEDMLANNYAVSIGAQAYIDRCWTIGTTAGYSEGKLDYKHDGSGRNRFGFAGIYGLYRPQGFYTMVDLIYGTGKRSLTRKAAINDLFFTSFSNPKACQFLGYIEAGLDHILWDLLVQPFLGLEVHAHFNDRVSEGGTSPLNLTVSKHNEGDVYSRLGAHVTMDQCWFLVSLDLVWKYHLNPSHHKILVRFQHFGKHFSVKDVKRGQSFFEGALAITTNNSERFDFFVEASGIAGYHSASYQALAGVQFSW